MKLNDNEQTLYDFFTTFGQGVGSIGYPIVVLANWLTDSEDDGIIYPDKDKVIKAVSALKGMDKPLFEAIKTIKGW